MLSKNLARSFRAVATSARFCTCGCMIMTFFPWLWPRRARPKHAGSPGGWLPTVGTGRVQSRNGGSRPRRSAFPHPHRARVCSRSFLACGFWQKGDSFSILWKDQLDDGFRRRVAMWIAAGRFEHDARPITTWPRRRLVMNNKDTFSPLNAGFVRAIFKSDKAGFALAWHCYLLGSM